ncbi:aspartate--tRNA ligase [Caulobacter sp. KR2-114]|uniref:aspartate--tRNA ligase n=1 Tax=Caulobacter sp. KR2-114 TaxID=3400912 RepID=UPI003BFB2E86
MHAYRTHTCGALRLADKGANVRVSGWIHRKRDHGGLMFVDLRDHYGLTQLVFSPETPGFATVERLRAESVIQVDGEVVARTPETINPNLPTGEIEVRVREVAVLSEAAELPLPVFGEPDYPEDIRLKYRFLDLRRESLHRNIVLRAKVIESIRRRMVGAGFTEFQTPILTASSPEGARDYLVPSRVHPGKFYALPQAPQQFKQLLMVAGFDRYFQIAPCFRDEDARADRSPGEFYQLDLEMSFATQEDVFSTMEPVLHGLFEEFADGKQVTPYPFPRIPYRDSIRKYGTDKPDLRNPLVMQDVSEAFRGGGFGVFARMLESPKNAVWALPAPGGGSRAFCDRMNSWAQSEGQPGLGYVFWREENGVEEAAGPIARNLGPERTQAIRDQLGLKVGDAAFFIGGDPASFYKFAGLARTKVGTELNLVAEGRFDFCWIVDFPMYEFNDETKQIDFTHNPFSMPQGELEALNTKDPLDILAYQYDIVVNGVELCSGGVRNYRPDILLRAFEIAGYPAEEVERQFAGMLNAFRYGAPPHAGMAPGVDRIVMLLAGQQNIREVIAFPLNQQGQDLMMNAPSEVSDKQLRDLHIRLAPPIK